MLTRNSPAQTSYWLRTATALVLGAWLCVRERMPGDGQETASPGRQRSRRGTGCTGRKAGRDGGRPRRRALPSDNGAIKATSGSLADAKPLPADGSQTAASLDKADTDREFNQVIAELQSLGAIDPLARQRLIDDLKKTDPVLWPPLIQYFRASLAQQRGAPSSGDHANASPSRASSLPPLFEKIPDRLLAKGAATNLTRLTPSRRCKQRYKSRAIPPRMHPRIRSRTRSTVATPSSRTREDDLVDAAQHQDSAVRTVSHTEDRGLTQPDSPPVSSAEWHAHVEQGDRRPGG